MRARGHSGTRGAWTLIAALATSSCVGNIGDGDTKGGDGVDVGVCAVATPRNITLLSSRHYGNAVRDLLGLAEAPEVHNAGGNPDALFPGGADRVSGPLAFEYQQIAADAAAEATANVDELVGCAAGLDETACAHDFIDRFGARAFRRPLTDDDRASLFAVFDVGRVQDGTFRGGIQLVIEAILQSPSFLYRTELGNPGSGGTFALTGWEIMTQLAFFLLDSVPDDALWKAAQEGRLETPEGLAGEVDRLLASPTVRANITRIFLSWFRTERLGQIQKTAPEFTPELQQSMRDETKRFVDNILWKEGNKLADLFTSTTTWVDEPLAALYGIPYPGASGDGFVEVSLPPDERAGILTQPSLLATLSGVDETSIVHRGLFVYKDLLCQQVAPPPANAAAIANEIAKTVKTERARAEYRMNDKVCGSCHSNFDPFGITFENYDAIGRYRTSIGDEPLDASWTLMSPPGLAGELNGAIELAERLAASPELEACTTHQLASYAMGHPLTDAEQCALSELQVAFEDAKLSPVGLIRALAIWPLLRVRRDGGQP